MKTYKLSVSLVILLILPLAQGIKPVQIDYDVFNAFKDGESVWFTTKDKGAFLVSPEEGSKEHLLAPAKIPINSMECGIRALGRIWLGTKDGLFYSEVDKWTWNRVSDFNLPFPKINCLAADQDSLWVGTSKGAARLEDDSWNLYTEENGLSNDWITDIEIHNGIIWFGTIRGGLNSFSPADNSWQSWTRDDGLMSNTVFSVSCSDSHAFIATASGFSVLDLKSFEILNYGFGQLPSSSVTSSAWSKELGQAWIGTGKGIAIWEEGKENLTVIEEVEEIELGRINGLETLNGVIWVMRTNSEWFYHNTTSALGFDTSHSRWIRPTYLDILIDQSGYSPGHPKKFMVQSNKRFEEPGNFKILSGEGNEVYSGKLGQRIDQDEWGAHYWKGDFTPLERRGNFTIEVEIGGIKGSSYRFEIDNDILLHECGELIYDFLTYMKCGAIIPGYVSKPCHLDDAVLPNGTHIDATGGWHCAGLWTGKYSEYHTYVLFNLLFAMDMESEFFEAIDRDKDELPDILNHAMWGCDFIMKMQENNGSIHHEVEKVYITDGIPGNNDDRPIGGGRATGNPASRHSHSWVPTHNGMLAVAAWAGTSTLIEDQKPQTAHTYLQSALRSFDYYHGLVADEPRHSVDAGATMMACIQLYRATDNTTYLDLAENYCNHTLNMRYSQYYGPFIPAALGYYLQLYPQTRLSEQIKTYIIDHANSRISQDTAPDDDLRPFNIPSLRNYKLDPEAAPALLAYEYTGNLSYLEYGLGIIDFHLGMNPYGICMLEGTGTLNPPGYANIYILTLSVSNPNTIASRDHPYGAHPGAIPQGIELKDGKPWYDTGYGPYVGTGETWLINTHFLQPIVLIPQDTGTYPLEVSEPNTFPLALLALLPLIGLPSKRIMD